MLRVLIAEDEDMIRKGLVYTTDWLSMDCVVVAEAANGREGLEKIVEYKPDVVIADICMPFMDGIEMIKKASEQVRFRSILLTSYADFEYARRAIEARVSEYLLKPVDEEALGEIMKKLGEEIASTRQVEHALEQAELEGGNLNLEYYMQLDLSENRYVSRTIEAIRERYAEKISIEGISEELGVSASYLSRKFKEITGQTFLDFLNKYRVQQAIVLLNTRQYRISEISEEVGFTDYKHFCSVFKKYTLKSPTKFIKGV
ncbi:response regulator transcription factor [Lacrimispora sp. 210928-DFI.3.58]|uniref:response regulator transcription factor n=1 Tax=Lacrimispora sp. 210928-DFI.3.58 TaxID=2883214 RepID=UPI0015B6FAB9|nr:response regulator [Lacrimispora sp. 210928-DFI.3.58]MCB7318385.1 response regulator [Lacrimispora sp. 210928-DFI.3.58]